MVDIPRKMTNEESIHYATIICCERDAALASARIFAAKNRIVVQERELTIAQMQMNAAKRKLAVLNSKDHQMQT